MRNMLDLAPYRRSLIGFDHLFDFMENVSQIDLADSFPAYDVEQSSEDAYRIRLALAGYTLEDIDVTTHEGVLIISGRKKEEAEARNYLYRGIAAGNFERRFQLADYVEVSGANFLDGVLEIDLRRELPEAAKPRKIAIAQAGEHKRVTRATHKAPQTEAA